MKPARAHGFFWFVAVAGLIADQLTKLVAFRVLSLPGAVISVIPGVFQFKRVENPGALFGMFPGQGWLFLAGAIPALAFVVYLHLSSPVRTRLATAALGLIAAGVLGNTIDRAEPYLKAAVRWAPRGSVGEGPSRADYESIVAGVTDSADVLRLLGRPTGRAGRTWVYRLRDRGIKLEVSLDETMTVNGKACSVDSFVKDFLDFVLIRWPTFNVADALLCIGVALVALDLFRRKHPEPASAGVGSDTAVGD